jgi:hypothetical protein
MHKPALGFPAPARSNEYREGASSSEDDSHFDCTVCIDDVRTSVGESVGILILFGMLMYHSWSPSVALPWLSTKLDYTVTK